jgi:hypothetical protein
LPRRAILAFAVALVVGIAFVAWRAGANDSTVAFSVGPGPTPVAFILPPRFEVCQTPIEVLADTDAVTFWVRTRRRDTPLEVILRDPRGRALGRDRVRVGAGGPTPATARFAPVREGATIALCIRNRGSAPVFPSGGEQEADSGVVSGSRRSGSDLTLLFLRERSRSPLSLVPTMFRRAAVFRFGWVGSWTFWALAALVLIAVPALCAYALARAARDPDQP